MSFEEIDLIFLSLLNSYYLILVFASNLLFNIYVIDKIKPIGIPNKLKIKPDVQSCAGKTLNLGAAECV